MFRRVTIAACAAGLLAPGMLSLGAFMEPVQAALQLLDVPAQVFSSHTALLA